jgi:nitroreductase
MQDLKFALRSLPKESATVNPHQTSIMKTHNRPSSRRCFLKQSALASGSLLFLASRARGIAAEPGAGPSPGATNPTLATLHRLRTIHGDFTDQEIPEESLQAILQASVRAANASNMQSYSIVVVRDREMMQKLCGYRGSRLLLYCADHNRMAASARSLGHAFEPDDVTAFVTAVIDTTLAAQTAAIAARSCGVDYLLTNGIHRGDMNRHWKLLDLPQKHCFPVIALVLGYPRKEPEFLKGRLDGTGVIHEGKYHHVTPEEAGEITRIYDDESRHLWIESGENWRAEGHKHYLDWMFTVWLGRPAKRTETPSQMLELIKRLGYLEA